jgi:hypothetical protein
MAKLTDDELAMIAQALRSYSALTANDAARMAPGISEAIKQRSESAAALAERIEKARAQRPA